MSKADEKKGFILYSDTLAVLDVLSDEQVGQLFRLIRAYHDGSEIEVDPIIRVAFASFEAQFIRDGKKYDARCETNRVNGVKGGRPPKEKPTETEKTQSVISEPKKPDRDSDKDRDSDTDSERDTDTSSVSINRNIAVEKKMQTGLVKSEQYRTFVEIVSKHTGRAFRGDQKSERQFYARIKNGWTIEQMEVAVINATREQNHIDTGFKYLTPEFFTREDKLDRFHAAASAPTRPSDSTPINRHTTHGDARRLMEWAAEQDRLRNEQTETE